MPRKNLQGSLSIGKKSKEFAYIISHDLRAPLRSIRNLITLIAEDGYDEMSTQSRQYFDLIQQQILRLDTFILNVFESSLTENGLTSEKIDLNQLLPEIIDTLSPPKHVKININNSLPTLTTHKALVIQVFQNLLDNAIRHNDKKNILISIESTQMDDHYQFCIKDNGPGIDKKMLTILQAKKSDIITNKGIGLVIAKKIIENQGGKILSDSTAGQGTSLYIAWPIKNTKEGT